MQRPFILFTAAIVVGHRWKNMAPPRALSPACVLAQG
jgi:hypothetical protein